MVFIVDKITGFSGFAGFLFQKGNFYPVHLVNPANPVKKTFLFYHSETDSKRLFEFLVFIVGRITRFSGFTGFYFVKGQNFPVHLVNPTNPVKKLFYSIILITDSKRLFEFLVFYSRQDYRILRVCRIFISKRQFLSCSSCQSCKSCQKKIKNPILDLPAKTARPIPRVNKIAW